MKFYTFSKYLVLILILWFSISAVSAQVTQKIGDNPYSIDSKAVLELESTTKGFLLPRMSEAQMNLITTPTEGMMLYCTDCGTNADGELRIAYNSIWQTFKGDVTGDVTGNAATVSTNANLTGPITSSGNTTSVASQTGTGSKFVMDTSPILVTPALGTPSALVGTNITGTASGFTAGNVATNANLTGMVTSTGNATTVVTNANLTGEVTSSGNATTLTNSAVIGKVLTGFTSGAGTISATDNILQSVQKLNGNDALKAPLASPSLTGVPTAPTAAAATNTTQLATTAFVTAAASSSNFVDLTTDQTIAGTKTFGSDLNVNSLTLGLGGGNINTNLAIGRTALDVNTTGNFNTAVGQEALGKNSIGIQNSAFGFKALTNNLSNYNSAFGFKALTNNTTGPGNTAVGFSSLSSNTTGSNNVAIGQESLSNNLLGSGNVAIGKYALKDNTGNANAAVGFSALTTNTTGIQNTALGNSADASSSSLTNATAIGYNAKVAESNTIQLGNTDVTNVNTSGSYTGSGFKTPSGTSSQFLKADGSADATSYASVASPTFTGTPQAPTAGAGTSTTQLATTAFVTAAASSSNFVDLTTAQTIAGDKKFSSGIIVNGELIVGYGKGGDYTSVAVGASTLSSNLVGTRNTAIGSFALKNNTVTGNTAIGYYTLQKNTTGSSNVAVGGFAGDFITTGSQNTLLGHGTDPSSLDGVNQTVIGYNAIGAGNNTVQLGNTSVTNVNTSGTYTGSGFKTPSGTAAQFLKANGSVDATSYAPVASPVLTGTPSAPTALSGTNSTQIATTAFVDAGLSAINTLASGKVYLGNGLNKATEVTLTGDVTLSNAGVSTIGAGKVVSSMILDGTIAAANIANSAVTTAKIAEAAINTAKILDGTILNADISASAAIAGTKISPNFGAQNISTTGTITTGAITLPNTDGTSGQVLTTNGSGAISWGMAGTNVIEVADEFSASGSQTSFSLSQTPSANSKVKMFVNGIRISNTAYSVSGNTLTYNPTNNGAYALAAGDRIQMDYYR